jgi:hypothetical protein
MVRTEKHSQESSKQWPITVNQLGYWLMRNCVGSWWRWSRRRPWTCAASQGIGRYAVWCCLPGGDGKFICRSPRQLRSPRHPYIHVCVCVCVCVCVHIYMYICVYTYIHMYTDICVYAYIHIYIHTYIHTYKKFILYDVLKYSSSTALQYLYNIYKSQVFKPFMK